MDSITTTTITAIPIPIPICSTTTISTAYPWGVRPIRQPLRAVCTCPRRSPCPETICPISAESVVGHTGVRRRTTFPDRSWIQNPSWGHGNKPTTCRIFRRNATRTTEDRLVEWDTTPVQMARMAKTITIPIPIPLAFGWQRTMWWKYSKTSTRRWAWIDCKWWEGCTSGFPSWSSWWILRGRATNWCKYGWTPPLIRFVIWFRHYSKSCLPNGNRHMTDSSKWGAHDSRNSSTLFGWTSTTYSHTKC